MQIADLIKIVDTFNANTLPGILPPTSHVTPGIASVRISSNNLSCCRDFSGMTKLSGKTTRHTSASTFVTNCLTLSGSNSVCVGAVIDKLTEKNTANLPVILAVGINYGQTAHYVTNQVPHFDNTKLRARLNKVFTYLSIYSCLEEAYKDGFHLVAANFFPWITGMEWSKYKFNSIEEAALIHCCGHLFPEEYICDLITRIHPQAVIFHGADNAVPYMGACVVRKCLESKSGSDIDVIFCDNLAYGRAISNAIKLCGSKLGRKSLSQSNFDE